MMQDLKPKIVLCLIASLLVPATLWAQGNERMEASGSLNKTEAAHGDALVFKLKMEIKPGFHSYPTKQKDPKAEIFVTTIRVKKADTAPVEISGPIKEPAPKEKVDPALGTIGYYEDTVEMEVPLKVKASAKAGPQKFSISLTTQVCDEQGCIPFNQSFDFEIKIKEGKAPKSEPPAKGPDGTSHQADETKPATKETKPNGTVSESSALPKPTASATPADQPRAEETLWSFTLQGIIWGFVTLLTPCVFPMIPITVSFFLKQESTGHKAIINAAVYALTIVIAMAIIAFFFVAAFQKLTQNGWTNFVLGALFIYFALSLFGMYEITLPSSLTRLTSAGEAKGGYVGIVFMALTFTIISFSCVAPFMGAFAGATVQDRPVLWNLCGALGFAGAFACPFFFLALFPSALKKLPKSGSWLNTMKVVMGFLEVAAALKFFRAAEQRWTADDTIFFTFDMVLGLYVILCILTGLYLLGVFRLPHDDHGSEKSSISVPRLIWSLIFLGLGLYLMPGLFYGPDGQKFRPAGKIFSWVEAFLIPGSDTRPISIAGKGVASAELKWFGFLKEALVDAKSKKQRIFIDFTGVT
jgi:thiol:disulfide interchange protein DsbD